VTLVTVKYPGQPLQVPTFLLSLLISVIVIGNMKLSREVRMSGGAHTGKLETGRRDHR
jgi:hypothetical protein